MSPLRPKSLKTYPGWKQLSAPQLWDTWLGVCEGNKDRAITHAVWFCALEIKRIASHWNHLKFASIRDEFVRRHSVSGVQIKRLTLPCLTCRGSGIEPLRTRKRCTVCRGTGARREFYNYAHTLNVYGGIMILHSIVPPPSPRLASVAGVLRADCTRDIPLRWVFEDVRNRS